MASRSALVAALSTVLVACGGGDSGPSAGLPLQGVPCTTLATQYQSSDPALQVTSAREVAAAGTLPAYCDVRGTIKGNVKFAVYMPKQWNGRFQMVGNGGKAGVISFSAMEAAIREGYAASSTDTGHDNAITAQAGARFGYDAEFGDEREIDFGWRAVHLTAVASKEIISAHYPSKIQYSYWNGCSTGGRQGLMEAQRFPEDFDGYIVGAPVYNYTRQQLSAPALLSALYPNGLAAGPALSPAKRDLIGNIVYNGNGGNYAGCDALDGVKDGQIRNPLACKFDPAVHVPACGANDGPNCLTATELRAVQGVYAGRPEHGILPLPAGTETTDGGWGTWLLVPTGRTPQLHLVMVDAFQYLLFQPDRPTFNYLRDFDWNTHPAQMDKAKQMYNATNPDLSAIAKTGKKIIMYHGWADPGVNPMGTIEYKNAVNAHFAGDTTYVDRFMKLYMVPGLGHCSGGPGHTDVNWMSAITSWVENGQAPQGIVGTKPGTASTRPHCPYPTEAVYNGTGSVDAASSYTCRQP
ncbi:MAG TPA: tannase/feruloyl esterase family alpha/beta hydrolase [Ramlibacter sp.]|jgi:feruloyl esterase|nr:tannase/feruloyl esterase family alpha/beta hydrolase [Ramlibacter sp.]